MVGVSGDRAAPLVDPKRVQAIDPGEALKATICRNNPRYPEALHDGKMDQVASVQTAVRVSKICGNEGVFKNHRFNAAFHHL